MLRRTSFRFGALALLAAALLTAPAAAAPHDDAGDIVVANRGSGDISVIDAATLAVETVALPTESPAEPMYVNHDDHNGVVYVGDRANSQVLVLDEADYALIDTIAVGDGVFHQWLDKRQLWVVGDTSDTVSVVDTDSRSVIETIDIPSDIVDLGGFPHDVFVAGPNAFVSILGLPEGGMVLQYSTKTFAETGRIDTGGDPHLFVQSGRLYVASQEGSSVSVYQARTLRPLGTADVPNAHGIWVTENGRVLSTNIGGGGTDAVFLLDRGLESTLDTVSTPAPVPHNLAVDRYQDRAFVTHSGATADQVSIIALGHDGFGTVLTVTVGTNPFGLGLVD